MSTLDAVQRVGELHKESKFKDLGLVMALFAEYSLSTPDYGLETTWEETFDDGEFEDERQRDWHETIVAYAKKADIDLKNVGVSGTVIREGTDVEAFDGEETDWGYADAVSCDKLLSCLGFLVLIRACLGEDLLEKIPHRCSYHGWGTLQYLEMVASREETVLLRQRRPAQGLPSECD